MKIPMLTFNGHFVVKIWAQYEEQQKETILVALMQRLH